MNKGLLIACVVLLFVISCKKQNENERVIARVGKATLTLTDLIEDIPVQIRHDLSDVEIRELVLQWINNEVLYQEADKRGFDERPDLQKQVERLRKELLVSKLIETAIGNNISVSEDEIKTYYENNKDSFILEEDMVKAYHALFKTTKAANVFRRRLANGEKFPEIIKAVFGDSLKIDDWDWGYFVRGDVIPEIANVVFNVRPGRFTRAIKSNYGYHVLFVLDKLKKGDERKLETVKEEIRLKLTTKKKREKYQRFLLQTKSKFKIQTNFQLLNAATLDSLLNKGEKVN